MSYSTEGLAAGLEPLRARVLRVWRFRWHGLGAAAAGVLIGALAAASLGGDEYASASVYWSEESLQGYAAQAGEPDPGAALSAALADVADGLRIDVAESPGWDDLYVLEARGADAAVLIEGLEASLDALSAAAAPHAAAAEGGGAAFRIVESPRTVQMRSGAARLATLVLLLAVGAGAAFIAVRTMEGRRPVVHDAAAVRDLLGVEAAGELSHAWPSRPRQRRRREAWQFLGGVLALLAVTAAMSLAG